MKRKVWILLVLLLAAVCSAAAADVKIDEKHFPDQVFREEVVRKFDTNRNGVLSDAELKAVKEVRAAERDIHSLKGIEYFTSATLIYCQYSYLTELDVSRNTELVQLNCFGNSIKTLDLSKNRKLEKLVCGMCAMTELDVSKNKELKLLYCSYSNLKELDVRKNEKLVELKLPHSFYLEKVKIGQKKHMEVLWASDCMALKELDISGCPIVKELVRSSSPKEQPFYDFWGWRAAGGSGDSNSKDLFIDKTLKLITGGEDAVLVQSIRLNKTKATIRKGKSLQLKVKEMLPENAANRKVTWSSSDERVATVSAKGKVRAAGKGTCEIICTAADGSGVTAVCKVTVK